MEKVKVLITGPVNGEISSLKVKLDSLQSSNAGPFDMCFCVGPFFNNANEENQNDRSDILVQQELPLPVYFCDAGSMPTSIVEKIHQEKSLKAISKDDAEIHIEDDSPEKKDLEGGDVNKTPLGVVEIASNLFFLHGISVDDAQTADILNIPVDNANSQYLTVAFFPPKARLGTLHTAKLESKTNHPSYVGCDLLLTSDWGQGMASSSCIPPEDQTKMNTANAIEVGSFDIAEVASMCRPRYHVAPSISNADGEIFFLQSLPYSNPPSAVASGVLKNYHSSRFLALCPVVDVKTAKKNGKLKKYIHALGIQPLWSMDRMTATAVPDNTVVVPSPYTDESYRKEDRDGTSAGRSSDKSVNVGLSDAQARRILMEDSVDVGTGDQYRWNMNRKRSREDTSEFDTNNCTLFLYGLHNDVTRGEQVNQNTILRFFQNNRCIRVRYPGGATAGNSSYAFLDFSSHEEASNCLLQYGGQVELGGVMLTLKWSSGGNRKIPPPPPSGHVGIYQHQKKTRLTEMEAADSSSIFVHFSTFATNPDILAGGMNHIANLAQKILENAVNEGIGDDERITANDDPALKVTSRVFAAKQNCGFLDFASHAAASMALAILTGSTDGGDVTYDFSSGEKSFDDYVRNVQMWWARAKDVTVPADEYKSNNGFHFKQLHFPPDARKDCWFCLASPSCQKHLIVSVNDHFYVTMPKGPVNEHHTLIVPVKHSISDESQTSRKVIGAFMDPSKEAILDLQQTKSKLLKFAKEALGKELFVFERAIPTKGGYHAHVNCIPIEKGIGPKLFSEMMRFAAASNEGRGFKLRELQNPDVSISSILMNANESGDLHGYFYAEIPFGDDSSKRLLYTMENTHLGTDQMSTVPLQFGREVLSFVLGNPQLAHWKACEQTLDVEAECTKSFRKLLATF